MLSEKSKRWLIAQGTHEVCGQCKGNGKSWLITREDCWHCNGEGFVKKIPWPEIRGVRHKMPDLRMDKEFVKVSKMFQPKVTNPNAFFKIKTVAV